MKTTIPTMKSSIPASKIILIAWVVFSILYVGYREYQHFNDFVAKSFYQKGFQDAAAKMIAESKTCTAVPVNVGEERVNLLNVDCLKQPEVQNNGGTK